MKIWRGKGIWPLVLVLVLVLVLLPVISLSVYSQDIPAQDASPADAFKKYVGCDAWFLGYTTPLTTAPENVQNPLTTECEQLDTSIYKDLKLVIKAVYYNEKSDTLWYQVQAAPGYTAPDLLVKNPWVFQDYVIKAMNQPSLKIAEPETVSGTVTDSNGNPMLGSDGKPLQVTVTGGLPAGATLDVKIPEINGEKLPNMFDIKVLKADGTEWQPIDEGKTVTVSIPVTDIKNGEYVNVFHVIDHANAISDNAKIVDISIAPDSIKEIMKDALAACGENECVAVEMVEGVKVQNCTINIQTNSFSIYVYDDANKEFDVAENQSGVVTIPNIDGTQSAHFKYYATAGSVFTLEPQFLGYGTYTLVSENSSGVVIQEVKKEGFGDWLRGNVVKVSLNNVSVGDTVTIQYLKKGVLFGDDLFYVDIIIVREIMITYDANSKTATGMPDPLAKEIATDGKIEHTVAAAPSAENCRFKGWNTSNDGKGTMYQPGEKFTPAGDMTLYAIWEEDEYDVTFKPNGGSGSEKTITVAQGATIAFPDAPQRENYSFLGWCASEIGEGDRYQAGSTITINAAATFYAVWGADLTITVSGNVSEIQMMEGDEYTWKDIIGFEQAGNSYSKEDVEGFLKGTTFRITAAGDSNFNAGSGKAYTASGATVNFWTEDGGKTLFVQLTNGITMDTSITVTTEKDKFTVIYIPNGGSAVAPDEGVTTGTIINPNDKITTRDAYTFEGWYSDAGLTKKVTSAVTITTHTTFYAKWTADPFKISYDLDGGSFASGATNPNTYTTETDDFTLNNPIKLGYEFAGWIGTGLINPTHTVTVSKGSTGSRSYTATWTPINVNYTVKTYIQNLDGTYSVTFETLQGKTDSTASVTPTPAVGFQINITKSKLSETIAPDGSTVLEIYYDRDVYSITATMENGTISGKADSYSYGTAAKVTFTPNAGYKIIGVTVNGVVSDDFTENEYVYDDTIVGDVAIVVTTALKSTTLKVQVNGCNVILDSKQSYLFTLKSIATSEDIDLDFVICEEGYVKIGGLMIGNSYTITLKDNWSWRYDVEEATAAKANVTVNDVSITFTLEADETVTFTVNRNNKQWLDGNDYHKNN